jgi:hypothetical protein
MSLLLFSKQNFTANADNRKAKVLAYFPKGQGAPIRLDLGALFLW